MRLTLRTLLAYRDGVMARSDAEDLHRRIQSSPFAANLLKRIDLVSKEVHRASPTIVGKGVVGDPNNFAEYLDDTLHGETVPELERLCLESNVHLSELAACHNLLSSAMHTRVQVPTELHKMACDVGSPEKRDLIKQRLAERKRERQKGKSKKITTTYAREDNGHNVVAEATPVHASHTVEAVEDRSSEEKIIKVHTPMVASGGETIKPQGLNLEGETLAQEVPEYLVGSNRGYWKMPLAIVALFAILAVLVWQSLGPWENVMAMFTPKVDQANESAASLKPEASNDSVDSDDDFDANEKGPVVDVQDPGLVNANHTAKPASSDLNDADRSNSGTTNADLPKSSEADSKTTQPAENAPPSAPPSAPPAMNFSEVEGGESTTEATTATLSSNEKNANATNGIDTNSDGDGSLVADDARVATLRLSDEPQVLLAKTGDSVELVNANQAINESTNLIVPPACPAILSLQGAVDIELRGPSDLTVGASTLHCRLIRAIASSTSQGNQFSFQGPVGNYLITLNTGGKVAIETAYRRERQGSLIEADVVKAVQLIVAVDGVANVQTASEAFELKIGEGLGIVAGGKPEKFRMQKIPAWYRSAVDRPVDAEALKDLAKELRKGGQGSVAQKLSELTSSKRPEESALAVQVNLLLGNWKILGPSKLLANPRMNTHWTSTLAIARQCYLKDVDKRSEAQAAFEQVGEPTLFDRFVGAPLESLATPEKQSEYLGALISDLNNDDLSIRVLAFDELRRLTGSVNGYLPQSPTSASIQTWRRELLRKRLQVAKVRDVLHERIPR